MIGGNELEPSPTATTVRIGMDGGTTVTDGPFIEGKELIGGYAILEAPQMTDPAPEAAPDAFAPQGEDAEAPRRPLRVMHVQDPPEDAGGRAAVQERGQPVGHHEDPEREAPDHPAQ